MNRRIVFLDVDGVLNSRDWYERRPPRPEPCSKEQHYRHQIDPVAVERVNRICEATGAVVVVSSTWRAFLPALKGALRPERRFKIIGKTPHLSSERGNEIQAWMDIHGVSPESIIILDDDSDMLHLMPRLVRTPHATGLTDEHVEQAIRLLSSQAISESGAKPE